MSAWLGKAIEAMDLTANSVDTVSVALGKFLHSCITLLPGALREAGTPRREKRTEDVQSMELTVVGILRSQADPRSS